MEKFDFENTTIFKELNELSSEEIKKWVEFILKKNFITLGEYFSNKIGKFYSLMEQMKESDERIINSIDNLTYTTSSSIQSLSNTVQSELNSINSSIKFNNLLTGIQTYQMYKVNTKSLKR